MSCLRVLPFPSLSLISKCVERPIELLFRPVDANGHSRNTPREETRNLLSFFVYFFVARVCASEFFSQLRFFLCLFYLVNVQTHQSSPKASTFQPSPLGSQCSRPNLTATLSSIFAAYKLSLACSIFKTDRAWIFILSRTSSKESICLRKLSPQSK